MLTRRVGLLALVMLLACKRRLPAVTDAGTVAADASMADAGKGAPDATAATGATYRTASGGFQVRFPEGKPPAVEEKTITGGGSAVHLFKVQYGTSGYIVSYDDFARGSSRTPQAILDGAREGVLESTGGTIDSEHPLTLEGHPGLELAVTATTAGITMRQRVRVLLVGGRLYQLLVVAPTWSGATAVEQDFFDSFKLLGDAGD
jgi:hypothetical protein